MDKELLSEEEIIKAWNEGWSKEINLVLADNLTKEIHKKETNARKSVAQAQLDHLQPIRKAEIQAAKEQERNKVEQEHIDAINDYGEGKITLDRLAEKLGDINRFELISAFNRYSDDHDIG